MKIRAGVLGEPEAGWPRKFSESLGPRACSAQSQALGQSHMEAGTNQVCSDCFSLPMLPLSPGGSGFQKRGVIPLEVPVDKEMWRVMSQGSEGRAWAGGRGLAPSGGGSLEVS